MDWWYVLGGIVLGWSTPWAILQFTDGMFILNQIFRLTFWGSFVIAYELTELNFVYCLILAQIPGALIWAYFDHWFGDGDDEPQKVGDEFKLGTSINQLPNSGALVIMPNSTLSPQ